MSSLSVDPDTARVGKTLLAGALELRSRAFKALLTLLVLFLALFPFADQIFQTIALPGSIPFIITGLRLAVGRAAIGVVVGEMYAATAGIGYLITVAGATFQTDRVFVGVMIICFFVMGTMALLQALEHHFEPWRQRVGSG